MGAGYQRWFREKEERKRVNSITFEFRADGENADYSRLYCSRVGEFTTKGYEILFAATWKMYQTRLAEDAVSKAKEDLAAASRSDRILEEPWQNQKSKPDLSLQGGVNSWAGDDQLDMYDPRRYEVKQ